MKDSFDCELHIFEEKSSENDFITTSQASTKCTTQCGNQCYIGNVDSLNKEQVQQVVHLQVSNESIEESLIHYNKLLDSKRNIDVLARRASVLAKTNNYKGALEDYNEILSKDSANVFALLGRSDIYKKLGKNKLALEDIDRVLAKHKNFSSALERKRCFFEPVNLNENVSKTKNSKGLLK